MTAFARTESASDLGEISIEMRSVNHRYLEMVFRLPEELRRFEPRYRELISKKFARGRVDANMRFKPREMDVDGAELNTDAVAKLNAVVDQLTGAMPTLGQLRAVDVLNWPGVIKVPELEMERLGSEAEAIFLQALDQMADRRAREGSSLNTLISDRMTEMRTIVGDLKPAIPEFERHFRDRLDERLKTVAEELDPSRVEQEVVIFLQKSDVSEELDRLTLHIDEVERVLQSSKPVGRRLDFLMQELNREANTLGSKAADPRVTTASVDLKVLIEQSREQVQNIE